MNLSNVRIIFCDVDGTLLPRGEHSLSGEVFDAIAQAVSSNISFCIASGRSYPDLKALFSPIADKLVFICNDGALIVKNDFILHSSPLNKNQVACMSKTYINDYDALLIYAKDYTYYISGDKHFDFLQKITPEDVISIPGDVYKVAFYNLSQKAKIKLNNLGIKSGILSKVYEDTTWTEYIKAQTDKGTATEFLQNKNSISSFETAAFGDGLNDLNMLKKATYSFAVNGALPEVCRMCKFKTNNVNNEILNIISERRKL